MINRDYRILIHTVEPTKPAHRGPLQANLGHGGSVYERRSSALRGHGLALWEIGRCEGLRAGPVPCHRADTEAWIVMRHFLVRPSSIFILFVATI